jgi:hypothetical protein
MLNPKPYAALLRKQDGILAIYTRLQSAVAKEQFDEAARCRAVLARTLVQKVSLWFKFTVVNVKLIDSS